jgi:phosphoserine phosphatase RsbU/P
MKRTLKSRMIFWIWGTVTLVFAFMLFVNFNYSRNYVKNELEDNAENLARYYDEKFDKEFAKASVIPAMTALFLETTSLSGDEEKINRYLKNVVSNNSHIYGAAIAFEPYRFNENIEYFSPYYYHYNYNGNDNDENKDNVRFVQLGKEEYNYLQQDWYRIPKEKNQPVWSEPYFDEGGGETLMITYSVPFYISGSFAGIATVDISLDRLTDEVNRIKLLDSGYGFMVSSMGNFLSFPDKSRVLAGNITGFDALLAEKMTAGQPGFIIANDPLKNEKSWIVIQPMSSTAFSIAFIYPEKEVYASIYEMGRVTLTTGFVVLMFLLMVIVLIANSITRPVSRLTEGVKLVAQGNLDHRIPVESSTYEVAALSESFNQMIGDLNKHIDEIKKITSEKERIESELEVAREIQLASLPVEFPPFLEERGLEFYAKMIPAKEVGGDFYDIFEIDDIHTGFAIGDASGKGIPAALYAAVCRAYLKATASGETDPGRCLEHINKLLCAENKLEMFITIFYGVIDTQKRTLTFSNAGHNPPCFRELSGKIEPAGNPNGPALGVIENARYSSSRIENFKGLFLYTDGITDAENQEGIFYSKDRLYSYLGSIKDMTPQDIVNGILDEIRKFSLNTTQTDDMTLMLINIPGRNEE